MKKKPAYQTFLSASNSKHTFWPYRIYLIGNKTKTFKFSRHHHTKPKSRNTEIVVKILIYTLNCLNTKTIFNKRITDTNTFNKIVNQFIIISNEWNTHLTCATSTVTSVYNGHLGGP